MSGGTKLLACTNTCMRLGLWRFMYGCGFLNTIVCMGCGSMRWLRLVGSLKLSVSFAEYRLFYRSLLQKTPIILRSLLTEATPYDGFQVEWSKRETGPACTRKTKLHLPCATTAGSNECPGKVSRRAESPFHTSAFKNCRITKEILPRKFQNWNNSYESWILKIRIRMTAL